jgi:DNA sulfur modification protein DndC
MINKFDKIKQHIQKVYCEYARPFVIGYSGGKDSTTVLQMVWNAVQELPIEKRKNKIYVITVDTKVETPYIISYINSTVERINQTAKDNNLPIEAYKLTPEIDASFWVNLIGKGYPAPSQQFRWCTQRLKIDPANKFIQEYASEYGEVTMVLGARSAESISRSQVLEKKKRDALGVSKHTSLSGAYVFTPIEKLSDDEVWQYLLNNIETPWGSSNRDLSAMYQNAAGGECPMVIDTSTPSCGNSRFGCWVCTLVSQDTSMENLIDAGEDWMIPLVEFRDFLSATQKPEDKHIYRGYRRRGGRVDISRDRTKIIRGPYLFEWRKKFLEMLLQAQQDVRENGPDNSIELISFDELKRIREIWETEEADWTDSVSKIYLEICGKKLNFGPEYGIRFDSDDKNILEEICNDHDLPTNLIARLLDEEISLHGMRRRAGIIDKIDKIFSEEWRSEAEVLKDLIAKEKVVNED